MKLPPIPLIIKASGMDIEDMLPSIINREASINDILYFCKMYRRMGICYLLLQGVPDEFFSCLYRSGRAFSYFLNHNNDEKKMTGKSYPIFDAIACNDMAGASLMAETSRHTWHKGEEYEDDFLYFYFIMKHFFLKSSKEESEAILAQYKDVLQDETDVRYDLCAALLEKDQSAFDQSLAIFLENQGNDYKERIQSDRLEPDDAATISKISIEGLAFVRLAKIAGLVIKENYYMIPSVALMIDRIKHPSPESWKMIESHYDLKKDD